MPGFDSKSPMTTRDALIAELLGDVGKLDEQIKALHEAIPLLCDRVDRSAAHLERLEKKQNIEAIIFSVSRRISNRALAFGLAGFLAGSMATLALLLLLGKISS